MKCFNCGTENLDTNVFCMNCGSPLGAQNPIQDESKTIAADYAPSDQSSAASQFTSPAQSARPEQNVRPNRSEQYVQPSQPEQYAQPSQPEQYAQPNYYQQVPQPQPPVTVYNNNVNQVDIPPQYRPLSPWAYFGYMLLFSIPIIGFIMLIIFSFSDANINRRNFARSYFCVLLFALIVTGIVVGILAATGGFVHSSIRFR